MHTATQFALFVMRSTSLDTKSDWKNNCSEKTAWRLATSCNEKRKNLFFRNISTQELFPYVYELLFNKVAKSRHSFPMTLYIGIADFKSFRECLHVVKNNLFFSEWSMFLKVLWNHKYHVCVNECTLKMECIFLSLKTLPTFEKKKNNFKFPTVVKPIGNLQQCLSSDDTV